ncbi:MAG TPA: hypothetical protein VFU38_02700, partial [Candidatus Krumholzibacteria bacterium]|nr:hypothetical protein [Candidatus Krumholzibacteria bacterium]
MRTVLLTLLLIAANAASAVSQTASDSTGVVESIEVKRAESKEPKHESLKFLKDNRVFIRAQIDLLRVQTTRTQAERAAIIDSRYLALKEMSAAIAAASDTVSADSLLTAQRRLMASVAELAELERQMAKVEALLADHRTRLIAIEGDFLGHQETALVIVMRGFAGKHTPATVVIAEDGEVVRVDLTVEQRTSLEQGGIAQVYHQFVEPRAHVFSVSFEGGGWTAASTLPVTVDAVRDRLTFLSLDLSRLDPSREAMG